MGISFRQVIGFVVALAAMLTWAQSLWAQDLQSSTTKRFFSADQNQITFRPTKAQPAALAVYRGGRKIGYVFSSFEVSSSLGFSGKPIDIHVGLRLDGKIAGAKLVSHQEPILVLGIPATALDEFVSGFKGFDIRTRLKAGVRTPGLPDAVAGASVSSGVIRDAIIRSARAVAQGHGMFASPANQPKLNRTVFEHRTWQQIVDSGAIARRKITLAQKNTAFAKPPPADNPDGTFIDLVATLATPPMIGQNLLRGLTYNEIVGNSGIGDSHIIIAANGLYSFRGRNWRKSGEFDRIQIIQGDRTIRLTKDNYKLVPGFHAAGAPEFREVAIFTLPSASGFNPIKPWRVSLLVTDRETGRVETFDLSFSLPAAYLINPPDTSKSSREVPADSPLWLEFWVTQKLKIAGVVLMLLALTGILLFQDFVARNKRLYLIVRLGFLTLTLFFLGFYAGAQLSVLNVLTFIHSLMSGFRWELFLLNPMVFILWGFVAVALLFLGRGVYCGWLCPFGALQELLNKAARALKIKQITVPWALHERLWPIKYIAFLAIFAVSLSSMSWAFRLAEIEPFKTAIILKFLREWPFVLFSVALLVAGLFIERFYCRYLCPLGAALGIPARLRMFEWLNRRHQCGRECRICNTTCTVQAINPLGQISPNECVYCLRCQVNYFDATTCRPLVDRARRRARPAKPHKPEVTVNAK